MWRENLPWQHVLLKGPFKANTPAVRNTAACQYISYLPLPSLPTSPACALCIGIMNFFVPHLTKVFHITSMHLAGEDPAITGSILSHSSASISCFFEAKWYQLAM